MAQEAALGKNRNARLPPEVNRALYVRNLPFNITADEMYDIFGKYGAIRSVKLRFEPVTGFALTARLENCAFGLFP